LAALAASFGLGFLSGAKRKPPPVTFHDMIVNHPYDLVGLITPDDIRVRSLAGTLETPENAFAFVRDRIANDTSVPALPAGDILVEGRASCLGKAVLLCSLYRAMGMPSSEVRAVTGEIEYPYGIVDHAWVEIEHDGICIQQDATNLLGTFGFDQFRGSDYTRTFIRKEGYTFNDTGFAVVSRLNQMKGTGHPPMR